MTPAQFYLLFPKFARTDQAVIASYIARLAPEFNVAHWDDRLSEGMGCAIAHMIEVENADGPLLEANDITGDRTENRMVSRDPALLMQQAKDWWMRTTYGQRYVFLRDNMVGKGALTVATGFVGGYPGFGWGCGW
jgi:hypothetical protein